MIDLSQILKIHEFNQVFDYDMWSGGHIAQGGITILSFQIP